MDNNSGGEDKADKKPGTRVFKKSSPNGKITVYLGKRDFVDHISHVDPIGELSFDVFTRSIVFSDVEVSITNVSLVHSVSRCINSIGLTDLSTNVSADGVVLVDPDYIKERKVFGHVLAAFRYGREDLDVLGLTFRKDLYLASDQIFPTLEEKINKRPMTRLQERLVKKLGPNAFPFFFEV